MRLFLLLTLVASASAQFGLGPFSSGFGGSGLFGASSFPGSGLFGMMGGMSGNGFGSSFGGLFGNEGLLNGGGWGSGLLNGMGNWFGNNFGNNFGGFGGLFSPLNNGLGDMMGSVCGCVQNIIREVAVYLTDVLEDVAVLITQLLNPGLPVAAKVQLIQRIIYTLPLPLQQRVQSLAYGLLSVASQLQYQPLPVQRAVSQVLALPFNQLFRRLSPVQQELIIQNSLAGLSQPQLLIVTNILNQFRAIVNEGQFGMGFPGSFSRLGGLNNFQNGLGFPGSNGFSSALGFPGSFGGFGGLNGMGSMGFSNSLGFPGSFGRMGGLNSFGSSLNPFSASSLFRK